MTLDELKQRQSWTFDQKLDHAVATVENFFSRLDGRCFVSFSGGKDSTVLLDLVRRFVDKNCPAVFCNTGAEYPDVVNFVHTFDNVIIIKPKQTFKEVIEERGFPLVSKEQSRYIRQARHTKSEKLRAMRLNVDGEKRKFGFISKKWRYLVNQPYDVSEECCDILKKRPFKKFCKERNLRPLIATTCDESLLRAEMYVRRGGCSSFEKNKEASYPLSIFLDSDIYEYIHKFDLRLCDLYKKGFVRTGCMACGFGAHIDKERFNLLNKTCPRVAKKFLVMKITVQNIKTLLWLLAALFLMSCSTSKHLQDLAPAAAQSQQQIIYLRDTISLEGETKTIVEHDTVNGKPIFVTTTTTKTKTIRLKGQTKIVRDTVFLPSKLIKAQTAVITKAQKNKGSERKFPYKIAIPILILLIFITILIFAYVKQYFSIKSVFNR